MPSVLSLPRIPSPKTALVINLYADVQLPDGSTGTFRVELADLVAALSGAGLPTLDATGGLVIGGSSIWNVDANGHLVCPADIPDTGDGFVPVPGSNVVFTDGGILKRA